MQIYSELAVKDMAYKEGLTILLNFRSPCTRTGTPRSPRIRTAAGRFSASTVTTNATAIYSRLLYFNFYLKLVERIFKENNPQSPLCLNWLHPRSPVG